MSEGILVIFSLSRARCLIWKLKEGKKIKKKKEKEEVA